MNRRQRIVSLGLLAGLYLSALVLLAPDFDSFPTETASDSLLMFSAGLLFASPPLLAIWMVHAETRAAKRLLVTTWLYGAFFLAAAYGQVRNYGCGDLGIVVIAAVGWAVPYIAVLVALSLLRTMRGWRLGACLRDEGAIGANDPSLSAGPKEKQFTIRTLLLWTTAAAALCAGVRWLAPYGTFETEWLADTATLAGALFQGILMGLLITLAGLPVLGIAWVVLADGRRPILRSTLVALTIGGIVGGAGLFGRMFDDENFDVGNFATLVELGVVAAGLFAVSVMRLCGYRLLRPTRPASAIRLHQATRPQRRFGIAWAAFTTVALLLAGYAPFRLETWRRADEAQRWIKLGWNVDFDDGGRIVGLTRMPNQDLAGSEFSVSELVHLRSLDFSHSNLTDIQLLQYPIQCPAMACLESLNLDGTWIGDNFLSHIGQFPHLKELLVPGTKVTDSGISHLTVLSGLKRLDVSDTAVALKKPPSLPHLESLNLAGTEIRDAELANLANFSGLKTLELARTNVTDAGLSKLSVLTALTDLDLSVTGVSDDAAATLSQFVQLRSLNLQLTAVSEAGYMAIDKALPDTHIWIGANDAMLNSATHNQVRIQRNGNLRIAIAPAPRLLKRLHARGNYPTHNRDATTVLAGAKTVTDAGLFALSGQTAIEELDLRDSGVTDGGVSMLSTLTSLRRLDLRGTAVTQGGCDALAKALPDCEILR